MVDELEMDTPLNDMLMEDNTEPVDIPQEEETLIDTSEDPQQATEAPEGAEAFDYLKATASKKARLTKRPQNITKLLAEQYKHLSPEENERLEQLLAEKRAEWQQQQQEEQQAGGGGGEGGKEDKDKGKEYVPLYPLARLRKVLKSDPDTHNISKQSLSLINYAAELLLVSLAKHSLSVQAMRGTKTMTVDDVLQAVHMREEYEFLRMDFPRRAGASAAGKKAAGAAKKKVTIAVQQQGADDEQQDQDPSKGQKEAKKAAAASFFLPRTGGNKHKRDEEEEVVVEVQEQEDEEHAEEEQDAGEQEQEQEQEEMAEEVEAEEATDDVEAAAEEDNGAAEEQEE